MMTRVWSLIGMTLCLNAAMAQPVIAGWTGKTPPDLARVESGHRNHVFYEGETVEFSVKGKNLDRFEVRDYWGEMVDQGKFAKSPLDKLVTAKIELKAKLPGWYKLYVYRSKPAPTKPKSELDSLLEDEPPAKEESALEGAEPVKKTGPPPEEIWGQIVGGTMFVIFRRDKNFPEMPAADVSGGSQGPLDQVMRGVAGIGPQRHRADASKPEETIAGMKQDVAIDEKFYLPYDPLRKRVLMMAFPNGTKEIEGVKQIAREFKDRVQYYEPRNEPNFGSSGADFATKELPPFYEAIKSVDQKLKVIGPGTVTIGPNGAGLLWIEDFLKAGGAKYIDAFSFHAYNNINGDLWLARKSMDALMELLKAHGIEEIEKWQTEQGFFACVYGAYQPRLQGRWTMLEMMVFEQYGLPKEHNHLWYDKSHGFWDFPTWWENDDGSLNPAAVLMRVWSEELYATQFDKRYNFGANGERLYIGSLFQGPEKQVAAFQSAGNTVGRVELKVTGGDKLRTVSAFGVVGELPVEAGRAMLTVPELPVYVELAAGQSIEVVPQSWGENLALAQGVKVTSSGASEHPVDAKIANDTQKIHNGELENWYYTQQSDAQPWMSNVEKFPAWVELALPQPREIKRVVVFAAPPWQWQGTLVDFELQYHNGSDWVTCQRFTEPAQTFQVYTPVTRTSVDSFFSDRWVFEYEGQPMKTNRVRLLVHEATWGGGATEIVGKAGGQTGPHQIMLREVELYGE